MLALLDIFEILMIHVVVLIMVFDVVADLMKEWSMFLRLNTKVVE